VAGVSDLVANGGTVTISGSGFGSFDGEVISWDDFEGESVGVPVDGSSPVLGPSWSDFSFVVDASVFSPPSYSSENVYSGTRSVKVDWSGATINSFGWAGQGPYDRIFVTYRRWMTGEYTGASDQNHKQFYFFGDSANDFPQGMLLIPARTSSWGWYNNLGVSSETLYNDQGWSFSSTKEAWQRWSVYNELNTPSTSSNGVVKVWLDGQLGVDRNDYRQRNVDNRFDDFRLGHMAQGFYDTALTYFDDLYIASTQARVELCDRSTWSSVESLGGRCEIQIPSAWSASSITITANQGALPSNTQAWLYVVDSAGRVNAAGVPVTIGDSTAPVCGDGTCDTSEDCATCEADCGACPPECGDGACDETEDCETCLADCGACPADELPTPEAGVACEPTRALVFPNFVPFGKQLVGSTSEPEQVTIRNDGAQPFSVTGISVDGPFHATGLSGHQELAPGETLDLSVRFQPASESVFEGTLTVSFEGLDSQQVRLLGYGRNEIPIVPLSACGILDQEGATYVLQNDVSAPGTCFSIQDDFITLDLNGYKLTYATAPSEHRHFGVLAAACWFIYLGDNPCGGSARGLVVKNGTIEQGSGAAPYSHGVAVQSINNTSEITVAHTTIIVSAKSSINIKIDYKTPLHIHHNTLISNVTEIFNRHQVEGVLAKLTNGSVHRVHDNVLRGGPQGGLQSTASDSQIYRNDISQNGHYTNDFSIYAWGDRMEVFDNYVHPVSGRGIQLDYADDIRVHHNVIEVKELPYNEEYSGCQLSGAYGIQIEGSTANNVVYANDVLALADECDGKAFRATGVDAGTNNLVCNNTFRGERVGNTDAIAAATSLGSVGGGVTLLDNTLIADTMHIHDYWSDAANVLFRRNIFRKGSNPSPSYVTFFFDNNRPVSNIVIEDGVFENGASHTQAMMRQVGSPSWAGPSEYYVAWTLNLIVVGSDGQPKGGADVTIQDASGMHVFSGTTDSNGRIETSLFEYRAFNSTEAPYNQEAMTPHLLTVSDGRTVTESIVMDAPHQLTITLD
jgi:hypothetical protein